MKIIPRFIVLFLLASTILVSGCIEPKTPEDTAKYFWMAMQKRDAEAAQKVSIDGSAATLLDKLKPQSFKLSIADTNGNRAAIETTLTQLDGVETREVHLTTVLFYQNEKWRVSIKQTENSLLSGTIKKLFRDLEDLGEELGDKLGNTINETLEETLPVLEEMINEGVKQLEDTYSPHSDSPEKTAPHELPDDETI